MKVLFDQGTPDPLRQHLTKHTVESCRDRGWSQEKNGELLRLAEQHEFDILLTTDQGLKYQQNLSERQIAIIVLLSTSWPLIQHRISEIQQATDSAKPGSYVEIVI